VSEANNMTGGGLLPQSEFLRTAVRYPHPALRATLPTRGRDQQADRGIAGNLIGARFHASISAMFTTFRGGQTGAWRITSFRTVRGETLAAAPSLSVVHSESIALPLLPSRTSWRLAGVASHLR
jgi:hypothetical protein